MKATAKDLEANEDVIASVIDEVIESADDNKENIELANEI